MSTTRKIFFRVLPIVLVLMVVVTTNVFAFGNFNPDNMQNIGSGDVGGITSANTAINKVWNTATLLLQILAVAAIVIAGVRYMFASADGKADIKKQTVGLIVGAILVFGATTVINFVLTITKEVAGK